MAQELEDMPLFPLHTVLFPHALVQLHVFEPRYRELVRDCLAEDRAFGIVLIRSGTESGDHAEPYLVGTAVRIKQVHTYADGRMDIQVQGERRFRIREIDEARPYLMGRVEPVIEHPIEDNVESEGVISDARKEFEAFIQRQFSRQDFAVQVVFPPDPVALSFTIANLLQMENLEKQRLLETTDTLDRLRDLLPIMRQQLLDATPPTFYQLTSEDLREWILPN
jgi:Lon protease-like protein